MRKSEIREVVKTEIYKENDKILVLLNLFNTGEIELEYFLAETYSEIKMLKYSEYDPKNVKKITFSKNMPIEFGSHLIYEFPNMELEIL